METSMEEMMLMEIFDTKGRIMRHLKEQQQLFDQTLRSSLLLRGIRPPPCLFNDATNAKIRGNTVALKQDLVPDPLLSPHKWRFSSTFGFHTDMNKPDKMHLVDTGDFHKKFVVDDISTIVEGDGKRNSTSEICNHIPLTDPLVQTVAKPVEVFVAPDRSLERITRSRSRQRALEKRNSEKKKEIDEKKHAASIEYTERSSRSRISSQHSQKSDKTLKRQKENKLVEVFFPSNLENIEACRKTEHRVQASSDLLNNVLSPTQQVHVEEAFIPSVLTPGGPLEAAQLIQRNTFSLEPKELTFEDFADFGEKELQARSDAQILKSESRKSKTSTDLKDAHFSTVEESCHRSGRKISLCFPEESDNERVSMKIIVLNAAEKIQGSGVLLSSPLKGVGLVDFPADQLREVDASFSQTRSSTLKHLQNSLEVNEALQIDSDIPALEELRDKIFVKTAVSHCESANINNISILPSQERTQEERNMPNSANMKIREPDGSVLLQTEVYSGDVAKVNVQDACVSAQVGVIKSRKSLDLPIAQFREHDGCASNFTPLIPSCFLNGGNTVVEAVASTAKKLQNDSTAEVTRKNVDFSGVFHRYQVQYYGKQKTTGSIHSDDVEIKELGSYVKDSEHGMLLEISNMDIGDSLSNPALTHCRKESNFPYLIDSHSLTHEKDAKLSHATTPFPMAEKPHLSIGDVQIDKEKKNLIDDLPLFTQSNIDDTPRDDPQIVNGNSECARTNSEILEETGGHHSYQACNSHSAGVLDHIEVSQLFCQYETDGCASLTPPKTMNLSNSAPQGKHDLEEKGWSSIRPESKESFLCPCHGTQNGEPGKYELRNCKYSALKDGELKFEGINSETTITDDCPMEKSSSLGLVVDQMCDIVREKGRECSCQEKEMRCSAYLSTEKSFHEILDQCGRCSSPFNVDESEPVFERFNTSSPWENGQSPVVGVSKLYGCFKFSSFRKTANSALQTCKSTSSLTPLQNASTKHKLHSTPNICQSFPNVLLAHMDLKSSFLDAGYGLKPMGIGAGEDARFPGMIDWELTKDSSSKGSCSGFRLGSGVRSPAASTPSTGKFSERTLLKSSGSSSGNILLKNPELTCFRIEEETNINEDNENVGVTEISETSLRSMSSGMKMPDSQEEFSDVIISCNDSFGANAAVQKFLDRKSVCTTDNGVAIIREGACAVQKHGNQKRYTTKEKENYYPSICSSISEKASRFPLKNTSKSKLSGKPARENENQSIIEKDKKPNNIITNISSFIPLVQQKKPTVVKRDIKVKALEVAENARRLEEKKEIDRKIRKEAAKIEREKAMLESRKQMEECRKMLELKKQKKLADAMRKRRKEEEEKRGKEKRRKMTEESRKQFRLQSKPRSDKEEKEQWHKDEKGDDQRKICGKETKLSNKIEKETEVIGQMKATYSALGNSYLSGIRLTDVLCEQSQAESTRISSGKVSTISNSLGDVGKDYSPIPENELQYDMSPYRGSDFEEEEEEEDLGRRKFIPLWARKESLIPILSRQQHVDPDEIFHSIKGCNLNEVLGSDNFSEYRDRNGRSESGYWFNDRFTREEEYQYKVKMGYIRL